MLSLKSLVKVSLIALSLVSVNSALAADPQLHGQRTTVEHARSLAERDYRDGTNVLVVNWSHDMVDVISPDTHDVIVLNPVGTNGNTFYIYSDFFYPSIYVEIRDHFTGRLLSRVQSNNFSTIEIRDSMGFRSTDAEKTHVAISQHKGI
jgi:hypothetical protein